MPAKKKKAEEFDWSEEAGQGFENVTQEDLGIPFLQIIQSTSPELEEDSPKYIEDAKAGMIINSATREILGGRGEPVEFVPCSYQKLYVEWTPRESGGGYVQSHGSPSILSQCTRNDRGQDELENGNLIVTTAYMFGLVNGEEPERAVVSFTSTQLKKARLWLSMMKSIRLDGKNGKFTPPMFSHIYHLGSVPEKNEKGSWFGWKIENAGMVQDKALVEEARETHQLASSNPMLQLPAGNKDEDEAPF